MKCYNVTSTDKLESFQLTLSGVALLRYEQLLRFGNSWEQTVSQMRAQFNSQEKQDALSKHLSAIRLKSSGNRQKQKPKL